MAHVCASCLQVVSTISRGMCPDCQRRNDRTRRPPAHIRYPAEYQRNRATLLADEPPCHWCGQPATTADHITPRSHGGGHDLGNLVPACGRCNTARGNRSPG